MWTCEECNLNFTSSQALGGHKATSLEHRQRQDSKKEKETKPSQPGDDVLVDGPLTEVWGGGCSLMTDSHENADAERPMRRKRMLADDSRFALQLHHEELKATRVQKVAVHGAAKAEGTAGKKVKKGMVGEAGVEAGRRTWGGETTAMKKTRKTDGTELDSEVEDLSREVHVQEQSGKQCKKPVSGLTRVALSQRLQAGLACDSCRQKHIRCVHMAAVATAPLSNLTTHSCQQQQQQHPEQQSAFSQVSASTNCHSSIGQMGDGVLNRFLGMEGGILLGREQELVAPHHSAPPPVAAPVMWQSRTARSLASSVSPSKSLQSSEKSCGSQSSTSVPSTALDPVRQVVNGGAAWLVGGSCSLVQPVSRPVAESAGVLDTGSGNKSRLSNNVTLKRARESHDGIGQSLAQLDFDHLGKDCKACDNCRQKHIRCVHLAAAAEPRKRGRVDAVARQDGSHSNPIESSTIDMNSDNGDNGANVVATSPALTLQVAKTPVPSRRTRSAFTTT